MCMIGCGLWQAYRDDPTILSWNLINEPRCDAIGCNTDILNWIEEMAPYLKSVDSNHLVTVGEHSQLSQEHFPSQY
jgi:endo-1,4-beta-mannosidase